jgi:hypothetical protein
MAQLNGKGYRSDAVLTVVVAARSADGSASACLDALHAQLEPTIRVVVVGDEQDQLDRPWVDGIAEVDQPVPELWSVGIAHARTELVALLAGTVVPAADWVALTLRTHDDGTAVVGGPIEPGADFGHADWAVYFCRYSPYLRPIQDELIEVPGDNASYRAEVLEQYADDYADGFWEPFVHARMRADGHDVIVRSERVVRPRGGLSASAFCRQRFAHGRVHGVRRSESATRSSVWLGMASAPLVPLVMTARVFATVFARRRLRARLLVSTPLLLLFYSCWAAGEGLGRLDALRRRS